MDSAAADCGSDSDQSLCDDCIEERACQLRRSGSILPRQLEPRLVDIRVVEAVCRKLRDLRDLPAHVVVRFELLPARGNEWCAREYLLSAPTRLELLLALSNLDLHSPEVLGREDVVDTRRYHLEAQSSLFEPLP